MHRLSYQMSSQAFAFVLILAILLVAAFLNLAYNVVPNIRAILNGVLGLDKEHCVEGPKASPTNIQESDKNQAKFDKDVELLKASIISEELRGRYYTAIGALFSLLTAILAAIIALSVTVSDAATKLEWLRTSRNHRFRGWRDSFPNHYQV
ncbi:hypothetical protein AUI06_09620 [archaeon 13_2_20CM_2_52_21]|nr:MAG: hypothetical protein AUI06_09620 [archaeon 13_2_20CM_2_52_21]OLD08938.1 MAG: hypothetical protein AUI95_01980 [Crenarchaeota archaeon 13_1_40CM_3_52_4]